MNSELKFIIIQLAEMYELYLMISIQYSVIKLWFQANIEFLLVRACFEHPELTAVAVLW